MYTPDLAIDMIQNAKKSMVTTFVQHEGLKNAMIKFIDIQTEVTKEASKSLQEATALILSESWSAAREQDFSGILNQFQAKKK